MTISSLGYIAIECKDLSIWREYATEVLGLMVSGRSDDDSLYLRLDDRQFRIVVFRGDSDRFLFPGWETRDKASFDETLGRIEAAGGTVERCTPEQADQRCATELARTQDPDGNIFELYYGRMFDYEQFVSPRGVSRFITGDMGLGHVVLPTPSLSACLEFYTDVLGFEKTDYMDIEMAPTAPAIGLHFLHCDNPRHHSLALFESEHPAGLIHMMLEVGSIDDVGYALDRCTDHGVHITATLGRHTNDRMISFYMRCPAGFEIEYGCNGWQVDWANYVPSTSRKQSFWGHKFSFLEPQELT